MLLGRFNENVKRFSLLHFLYFSVCLSYVLNFTWNLFCVFLKAWHGTSASRRQEGEGCRRRRWGLDPGVKLAPHCLAAACREDPLPLPWQKGSNLFNLFKLAALFLSHSIWILLAKLLKRKQTLKWDGCTETRRTSEGPTEGISVDGPVTKVAKNPRINGVIHSLM